MNRLKTTDLGGMPFDLDDIRWTDDSVREAFYGLMSAFGVDPASSFIISGCVITGLNYTDGYISLNGEICKVLAGTAVAPGAGEVIFWDFDVSYDSAGLETFENATSHDTYQLTRAISKTGVPGGLYMPFNAETIGDKITNIIMFVNSKTYTITAADVTFVTGAGTFTSGTIRWKKIGKFYLLNISMLLNITTPCGEVKLDTTNLGISSLLSPTLVAGIINTTGLAAFSTPPFGTPTINIVPIPASNIPNGSAALWGQLWVEVP